MTKIVTFPRPIDLTKKRAVGIENELDYGPRWSFNRPPTEVQERIMGKIGQVQKFDCGGLEWVTKPIELSYLKAKRGQKELDRYYTELKKISRVTKRNGTHIHVSILDDDTELLEARVLVIATLFYKEIQKVCGRESIKWANSPHTRNMEQAEAYLARKKSGTNKHKHARAWLIITPTCHQTLEFRGPKSTVDKTEITAWVEFMENIVRVAKRKKLSTVKFEDLLRGDVIGPYSKKLRGWRYISKEDREKKITKGLR